MRNLYKKLFLGFFCCLCLMAVSGQSISTLPANGLLPDTFLNRYFAGEGVKLHNCKFNWSSSAINGSQVGTFANTNSQFPFSSGVLLTTGNISVAQGPNSSGSSSSSTGVNYAAIDQELQQLVSNPLNNASVLEFNFYSGRNENNNVVSFNYIFGSEEYPEYVCDDFNDVFGFFLYGPDPFNCGGQNISKQIAFIPGAFDNQGNPTPVSINTVNGGGHESEGCPSNSTFFRNNINGQAIQYDGYTARWDPDSGRDVGMTAEAILCSCTEYKMKISIANVQDGSWDSGVFLEKGSFKMPKEVTITDSITTMGLDTLIEDERIAKGKVDVQYEGAGTPEYYYHFTLSSLVPGGSSGESYRKTELCTVGEDPTIIPGIRFSRWKWKSGVTCLQAARVWLTAACSRTRNSSRSVPMPSHRSRW